MEALSSIYYLRNCFNT